MKELNSIELTSVSAGYAPPTNIHPGMNAGTALTSFKGLGYVGAAFSTGYLAGGMIAEHTNVDEWLANQAWRLLN